jgi:hypothetical protein
MHGNSKIQSRGQATCSLPPRVEVREATANQATTPSPPHRRSGETRPCQNIKGRRAKSGECLCRHMCLGGVEGVEEVSCSTRGSSSPSAVARPPLTAGACALPRHRKRLEHSSLTGHPLPPGKRTGVCWIGNNHNLEKYSTKVVNDLQIRTAEKHTENFGGF